MATIKCPAPNCNIEWPADTPTDILTRLLDIHSATAHAAPACVPTPTPAVRAEKIRRPMVSAAGTSETWAYFVQRWTDYKQATHLNDSDTVFQLLGCCDIRSKRRTPISLCEEAPCELGGRVTACGVSPVWHVD